MSLKSLCITLLLQILLLNVIFAQNENKAYNHELATSELDSIVKKLKAGKSFEINPKFCEYIYLNSKTFPSTRTESNLDERMLSITPVFTKLSFLLKSMVIESKDSISIEHAMIMATMGYQSVKLISLANEYMETLDENDPSYIIRKGGYDRAINGIQTFIIGYVITTFKENKYSGVDDVLTSSIIEFTPEIMKLFPKAKRKPTISLIKKYVGDKKAVRLGTEYKKLLRAI